MAQQQHTLLTIGALGAAAIAGYEFLYKPWKAEQDAALLGTTTGIDPTTGLPSNTGNPGGVMYPSSAGVLSPIVDTGINNPPGPYVTAPVGNVGIPPSNLDPGAAVGGPIGTMMTRKNWTQQQATDRYNLLQTTYAASVANLNALTSGQTAQQIQAALAAENAALQAAGPPYNAALARGDAATANQWKIAIDGHNQDIAELNARLQAINSNIAAYQNQIAGLQSDYYNLTGLQLG